MYDLLVCPICGGWVYWDEARESGSCDTCDYTVINGEVQVSDDY